MEFNLFIVPITLILTQLAKPMVSSKWLPHMAVAIGLAAGLLYGIYYNQDLFNHAVLGLIYGASASGIYDVAKSSTIKQEGI